MEVFIILLVPVFVSLFVGFFIGYTHATKEVSRYGVPNSYRAGLHRDYDGVGYCNCSAETEEKADKHTK